MATWLVIKPEQHDNWNAAERIEVDDFNPLPQDGTRIEHDGKRYLVKSTSTPSPDVVEVYVEKFKGVIA